VVDFKKANWNKFQMALDESHNAIDAIHTTDKN
jgi:hypothetical protein